MAEDFEIEEPQTDQILPLPKGYEPIKKSSSIPPLPKGYEPVEVKKKDGTPVGGTISSPTSLPYQSVVNNLPQFGGLQPSHSDNTIAVGPQETIKKVEAKVEHDRQVKEAIGNTVKLKKNQLNVGGYNFHDNDPALVQEEGKLKDRLASGELQVIKSPHTGQFILARKDGFLGSFSKAWDNVKNKQADDKYIANLSTEDKIKHFEVKDQLAKDEYLPATPSGLGGAFGTTLGENADALVKMGATATASGKVARAFGAGEAAIANAQKFGSFLSFATDAGYSGYADNTERVYRSLRQQDPNGDKVAQMKKAETAGLLGEAVGIGGAAAMTGAFPRLAAAAENINVQPLVKSIKTMSNHTVKEAGTQGAIAAGTSILSDLSAISQGADIKAKDVVTNAAEHGENMAKFAALMGAGMGIVAGIAPVSKYVKAQATGVLSKVEPETLKTAYTEAEQAGQLPSGSTEKAMNQIATFNEAKKKVPNDLPDENVNAVAGIQQKIDKLEGYKKTLAPQFHDRVDALIEPLKERAKKMATAENPLDHEIDDLTGQPTVIPKEHEELKKPEREGIVVPKEYGTAELVESGEGENKTYKPKAYYTETSGGLSILRPIKIEEEKTYTDKDKAQKAADEALGKHYYENAMPETDKPIGKETKPTELTHSTVKSEPTKEEIVSKVKEYLGGKKPKNIETDKDIDFIPLKTLFKNKIENIPEEFYDIPHLNKVSDYLDIPEKEVEVDKIVPTQNEIEGQKLYGLSKFKDYNAAKDKVFLFEKNGKFYIADGTHRIVAQMVNGKDKIKAHVIEYNEKNIQDSKKYWKELDAKWEKQQFSKLPDIDKIKAYVLGKKVKQGESEALSSENFFKHKVEEVPVEARQFDESKINELPTERINIDELIPTQYRVDSKSLYNLSKVKDLNSVSEKNVVIKKDGKYYLLNGHTRTVSEIVKGKKSIIASVIEPSKNKTTKDTKQATQTIESTEVPNQRIGEAKEGTGEIEPPNPPTEPPIVEGSGINVQRPKTELSFSGLQDVANEFGYQDVKSRDRVSDLKEKQNAFETANKWLEEGEYAEKVEELLTKINNRELVPTAKQRLILQQHLANEVGRLRAIKDIKSAEFDTQLKEVQRIKEIGQIARQEAGAALRIGEGQGTHPLTDFADAFQAKKDATGVETLTEAQKEQVAKSVKEYEEKNAEAEAKLKILEEENAILRAEQEFKKTTKSITKTNKSKEDVAKVRENIKQSIKDKWKKAANDGTLTAVPLPYAKQLYAISGDVAKLVKSYVEEGFTELKEVVKRVMNDIKEFIPEITERDVHDIIAGEYNEKKPTRNTLAEKYKDLRDEATLINKLERLLAGTEPKNEKQRIARNREITELQKQIKDFRKEEIQANKFYGESERTNLKIERMEDELNRLKERRQKEQTPTPKPKSHKEIDLQKEIDAERKKIAQETAEANKFYKEESNPEIASLRAMRNRNNARAAEIAEKIKNKDFAPEEKSQSIFDNKELQRKYPKLYKEAIDAIKAKEDAKHDFDIALLKDENSRRGWGGTASDWLRKGTGTVKAVVTGIDDSGVAIQTYLSSLVRPVIGAKALALHASHAVSQKRFDRWITELHNSDWWPLIKDSGLSVTEPMSLKAQEKEEAFSDRFSGTINFRGKEYKLIDAPLKPFERAFTTLGNATRVLAFKQIAGKYMQEGNSFKNNPKLFKDLASMLNTESGRGKENEYIQKASKVVTKGIWSPKLMSSKLNVLGISDIASIGLSSAGTKGYYRQLDPKVRARALRDVAQFTGTVIALTTLGAMSFGGKVDWDPYSSTFMDVKLPSGKSFNLTGGHSAYIRTLFQAIGRKKHQNGEEKKVGTLETLGRFMRGKTPPITGSIVNAAAGKDFMGKPTTFGGEISKLYIPISIQGIKDQWQKDGVSSLMIAVPTFIGFNIKYDSDFDGLDKDLPTLLGRNLLSRDQDKKEFKNHNEGGRKTTEAENEKYNIERNAYIEKRLKKLWEGTDEMNKVINDKGEVVTKHFLQMTKDERVKATSKIKSDATEETKKKLFGEHTKTKSEEELEDEREKIRENQ